MIVFSSFVVAPVDAKVEILPDEGVLYFTNKLIADNLANPANPTGAGGPKIFEATDVAPTEAASKKAYTAPATVALSFETAFQWAATAPFTIEGDVTASFWLSCDVAAAYSGSQVSTFRLTMKKNGATIGSSKSLTDASPQTCGGPTSIREVSITLTLPKVSWKVGDSIGASFAVWAVAAPEAAAKNMHFLVGSTAHPSHLRAVGIPLVGGTGGDAGGNVTDVIISYKNETLNGTTADVEGSFDNVTNAIHTYNWTTEGSEFVISHSSEISNGSVAIEFLDGAGARVHNLTLTSANNTSGEDFTPPVLLEAAPGEWVIRLEFQEFVGQVKATVGVAPPAAANETIGSNETAAAQTASEGGIPSVPLGVFAVSLVAIVALRRRLR